MKLRHRYKATATLTQATSAKIDADKSEIRLIQYLGTPSEGEFVRAPM